MGLLGQKNGPLVGGHRFNKLFGFSLNSYFESLPLANQAWAAPPEAQRVSP
jgi:hypothetical protein